MFSRPLLLALCLLPLLESCRSHRPVRLVAPANELRLYNRGSRPVGGVRVKPCGTPEASYTWLSVPIVPVGSSLGIPLQPGCVDLSAVSSDGIELGRQFDLNMIPGSTWEIR